MTIDTKKLRELAEAATPGPWVAANGKGSAVVRTEHPDHDCAIYLNVRTCETDCTVDRWQADARFIAAANPIAVIQLLDGLASWKGAAQGLRDTAIVAEQHLANRGEDILRLQQQLAAANAEIEGLRKNEDEIASILCIGARNEGVGARQIAVSIKASHADTVVALHKEIDRLRTDNERMAEVLSHEEVTSRLDFVEQQLAAMTKARDEACCWAEEYLHARNTVVTPEREARIAELRKIGTP